ncbi:MAG TPA: hypothetical protein VF062_09995 [Candidatus Limnocylindrales bacterium]
MPKSVKRKKQDRRQRQQRAADSARRRGQQAERAEVLDRVQRSFESFRSPDTPVEEVAGAIIELWEQDPPRIPVLGTVIDGEPERLTAVAKAVSAAAPGSLASSVLAIELAGLVRGEVTAAETMLDEVLGGLGDGPGEARSRIMLGHRALVLGNSLRAFRIAQAEVAAIVAGGSMGEPGGDDDEPNITEAVLGAALDLQRAAVEVAALDRRLGAVEVAALDLQRAAALDHQLGAVEVAALGRQRAAVEVAAELAGGAGEATIAGFTDDGGALARMRAAVEEWLARQPDVDPASFGDGLGDLPEEARYALPVEAVREIVRCAVLLRPAGDGSDSDDEGQAGGPPPPSLMSRFTTDPATPPEVAELAGRWHETIHLGLWRADDSVNESAGTDLIDLVTGVERYVPTASLGDAPLARWSVLLGALVCVDGVWRPAAPMVPLSPAEGDALTEMVHDAAQIVVDRLAGGRRRGARSVESGRAESWPAEPHGVFADTEAPAPPLLQRLMHTVAAAVVDDLVFEVATARSAVPGPRAPEVDSAWVKHWLDENVPALKGRTPRQAARSERYRPMLEALLRQFEWDNDTRAQAGAGPGADLAWIREELDMPTGSSPT